MPNSWSFLGLNDTCACDTPAQLSLDSSASKMLPGRQLAFQAATQRSINPLTFHSLSTYSSGVLGSGCATTGTSSGWELRFKPWSATPPTDGAGVARTAKKRPHVALDIISPKWNSTLVGVSVLQQIRRSRAYK